VRAKILIVDDERDLVDAYVRLLQRSGHRCLSAFDADQAIKLIDSEAPDLVLTDLSLPAERGLEVISHAHARSPRIAVIVMSGHQTPELEHAARAAGACACLLKPVAFGELTRVIDGALESSR
jgi:two-component system, NtrC family, nitrogen regulation response regulator NtrX